MTRPPIRCGSADAPTTTTERGASNVDAAGFEYDKHGMLEVFENESEPVIDDGTGNVTGGASSSTGYRWNGRAFQRIKK